MVPIIQAAIDTTDIERALFLADCAVEAGVDWLEVGHPLVVHEGVKAIQTLTRAFPETYVLVDFMIMAGGKNYFSTVRDMGARNATILGLIPYYSIRESVQAARIFGVESTVDLFNSADVTQGALDAESYVQAVKIPVSFATYSIQESVKAVKMGAKVIVVGEPLLSAADPKSAFREFVQETKAAA
jgi:3-hexulose-6-phosphate synthase